MAIFSGLFSFLAAASAFISVASYVAPFVASIALSYAAKALAGNAPEAPVDHFSVQGALQSSGDVPRSFNVGYSVTAGSLVYANTWGVIDGTPNAFFTQVIALQDLPCKGLAEVWVNGEKVTLTATAPSASPDPNLLFQAMAAAMQAGFGLGGQGFTDFTTQWLADHGVTAGAADLTWGYPVLEYRKDGKDHLWVKFFDGTQTQAEGFMVGQVSSAERPYEATRVGVGVCYAICTALVEDTLFTGFPTYKFGLLGTKLYDPSQDSSNGVGVGAQRYSDPATWGGDGDDLPAVQVYNLLRGISYNGTWLYGLQQMTAARLPAVNWVQQIEKCRAPIANATGFEPTYRSGGQINVDAQTANTIEALLTACQGRLSEVGGFYKIHVGAPDSYSNGFTDAEILSTEEQNFAPFFGLADSVNGITATYPSPAQGWNNATAPALYNPDFEAEDGGRRLLANPSFDFVPYDAQVQRLMKSALDEARRARRHTVSLGPEYWDIEPGDVVQWSSVRNGYVNKLFRADGVVDRYNLDVLLNITEVDPSDYDWDHNVDYRGVSLGPTSFPRPAPQGILEWFAEKWIIKDADDVSRRPAIRMSWDGTLPGVTGIQYEVRLASDNSDVTRGRSDQLALGAIIVSQSILPNTTYGIRGQYIPSAPRDMLWSDWLPVTTDDVSMGLQDFDESVVQRVTTEFDAIAAIEADMDQRISTLTSKLAAASWLDIKSVRSQLESRSGAAFASINEVRTVATDASSAVADLETAVNAEFDDVNLTVTEHTTAIAQIDGYVAGSWGVVIDAGGNVVGAVHLDGTAASSVFGVTADTFQVSFPGHTGGAAVPVFAISNVSGTPKLVWRGDMVGDGSLMTQMIAAGAITTVTLAAQAVTAAKVAANSITAANGAIDALAVQTLNLGDNAVTLTQVQVQTTLAAASSTRYTVASFTASIPTTGIAGKVVSVGITFSGTMTWAGTSGGEGGGAGANMGVLRGFANGVQLWATNWGDRPSSITLKGVYSFTATGGTDTVAISVDWLSSDDSASGFTQRTLEALTVKR